mgnify:CR=1 FL=1|tara:strand:- start:113 stop:325 length:213 start_codon:yes stop_codon:yes gene_type:complete
MSITNLFKTKWANLLKVTNRRANFAKQVKSERKAFVKLISQQSTMLDEYETLVAEYDEQLNSETKIQSNE